MPPAPHAAAAAVAAAAAAAAAVVCCLSLAGVLVSTRKFSDDDGEWIMTCFIQWRLLWQEQFHK